MSKINSDNFLFEIQTFKKQKANPISILYLLCILGSDSKIHEDILLKFAETQKLKRVIKIQIDVEQNWSDFLLFCEQETRNAIKFAEIAKNVRCENCTRVFIGKLVVPILSELKCSECLKELPRKSKVDLNRLKSVEEWLMSNQFVKCNEHPLIKVDTLCFNTNCKHKNLFCINCKDVLHAKCNIYRGFKKVLANSTIQKRFEFNLLIFLKEFNLFGNDQFKEFIGIVNCEIEAIKLVNYWAYFQHSSAFVIEMTDSNIFIIKSTVLEYLKSQIENLLQLISKEEFTDNIEINKTKENICQIIGFQFQIPIKVINQEDSLEKGKKNLKNKEEMLVNEIVETTTSGIKKYRRSKRLIAKFNEKNEDCSEFLLGLNEQINDSKRNTVEKIDCDLTEDTLQKILGSNLKVQKISLFGKETTGDYKISKKIKMSSMSLANQRMINQELKITNLEQTVAELKQIIQDNIMVVSKASSIIPNSSTDTNVLRTPAFNPCSPFKILNVLFLTTQSNNISIYDLRKKAALFHFNFRFVKHLARNSHEIPIDEFDCILLNSFDYNVHLMGNFINNCVSKGINVVLVGFPNEYDFYPKAGFQGPFLAGSFDNGLQGFNFPKSFDMIFKDCPFFAKNQLNYRIITKISKVGKCDVLCNWNDGQPMIAVRSDLNALITSIGYSFGGSSTDAEFFLIFSVLKLGKWNY